MLKLDHFEDGADFPEHGVKLYPEIAWVVIDFNRFHPAPIPREAMEAPQRIRKVGQFRFSSCSMMPFEREELCT